MGLDMELYNQEFFKSMMPLVIEWAFMENSL